MVKQNLIVETDILKNLNHPNLPSIIDVIDREDSFLIVMDYIEGKALSDVLKEYGAQPQEYVIEWAKQLCDVLGYLHSRVPPIIYRDMKPSNVMLKPDGNLTLVRRENLKPRKWRTQLVLEQEDMQLRSSMEDMDRLMEEQIFTVLVQQCTILSLVIIHLSRHMKCIR